MSIRTEDSNSAVVTRGHACAFGFSWLIMAALYQSRNKMKLVATSILNKYLLVMSIIFLEHEGFSKRIMGFTSSGSKYQ